MTLLAVLGLVLLMSVLGGVTALMRSQAYEGSATRAVLTAEGAATRAVLEKLVVAVEKAGKASDSAEAGVGVANFHLRRMGDAAAEMVRTERVGPVSTRRGSDSGWRASSPALEERDSHIPPRASGV